MLGMMKALHMGLLNKQISQTDVFKIQLMGKSGERMFQKKGIRSAKALTLGMQFTYAINHKRMRAVDEVKSSLAT